MHGRTHPDASTYRHACSEYEPARRPALGSGHAATLPAALRGATSPASYTPAWATIGLTAPFGQPDADRLVASQLGPLPALGPTDRPSRLSA